MTPPVQNDNSKTPLKSYFEVFKYTRRAIQLVWTTSPKLTLCLIVLSVVAGFLPAAIAYVGKFLVDQVVAATQDGNGAADLALKFVVFEAVLVATMAFCQKGLSICQNLLRALLGNRVNELILEKALTLSLTHFEDSEVYDQMTRARRQASSKPLALVVKTFGLIQNGISLVTYGALLFTFSSWVVVILGMAAIPVFLAETKFSGEAFRLFRWRTPETRKQIYIETLLAREDYAKEIKLFDLGKTLLGQYHDIFLKLFSEDKSLSVRRAVWGYLLGLLSTIAFYGTYAWIVVAAVKGQISLGEMTMYVMVFKQGQSALSALLVSVGGMYEDNLYLSNLYEFLEIDVDKQNGVSTSGPVPQDGIRFENVYFKYPGADDHAIDNISFHLQPGKKLALVGENGSGKTTLIKLLTRLYRPTSGRILLDGLDLNQWDESRLRQRTAVIFQDFVRYQFTVGENIGAGEKDHWDHVESWKEAATMGMAAPFIEKLPDTYQTQLGRWFKGGRELSLGQWQKIALSRAFIRDSADIIVLDEPTASMDAGAEAKIFEHFKETTDSQMAIVISHRFSTVRMADEIIVLDSGKIEQQGDHRSLMGQHGRYKELFELQAKGYLS